MNNAKLLILAIIEQCRALLQSSAIENDELPDCVRTSHLLQMCNRIEANAETWPETKLHRWIGYIQCGMLAHRIIDISGTKAIFNEAMKKYGPEKVDQDLLDHLDPDSSFRLDLGGEG